MERQKFGILCSHGFVNLKHIEGISNIRKALSRLNDDLLQSFPATRPIGHAASENNNAYYPIVFADARLMQDCIEALETHQIYTRRYFYPSLAKSLPYVDEDYLPNTDSISKRVLCPSLYFDFSQEDVEKITQVMIKVQLERVFQNGANYVNTTPLYTKIDNEEPFLITG